VAAETFDAGTLIAEIDEALVALPTRETAAIRALRRDFSRRLAGASADFVLDLAFRLLQRPDFSYRFLAYEFVHFHRATLQSLRAADVVRLGQGLDSWYAVDTFAPYIAGPAWREGQVPDSLIHEWASSPDRWWRRAALVCTVALNNKARGGRGDSARTLAVCRLLVADRDDMVVKAMSWALRELAKHDAVAVETFLVEYDAKVAPRVRREVANKLSTGLKNPRKTM
jgi:3-methyladenine DNA glycosylase AlkD